ncbi:hypothetical protein V8541_002999 [Listeria monocytogenes]|uniref:hypothetical protein n=1 Tax=Listeria monocytogenes TaxID=1639 RepID=UPI00074D5D02|nr:hypothetical protein [Listeria monocytogenes]EAG7211037.1 hypothetical protein [Listeria monocytogenes]EAG7292406.1 hypothetical protein [Listeria monocytogenes]EAG7358951.1 hypothetical protein [Listeria monocytogenes]EAH1987235.1 hypothetical protein [Listeria monocytogenes]EAH3114464.1 hypothetical protein [Listeria monocytogenes]
MQKLLRFDTEQISDKEILENANFYREEAEKGMGLLRNKRNKDAMQVLRDINIRLKEEYKFYNLKRLDEIIRNNKSYNIYHWAVIEAYAKQNRRNSYATLNSNLWSIEDYMNFEL